LNSYDAEYTCMYINFLQVTPRSL